MHEVTEFSLVSRADLTGQCLSLGIDSANDPWTLGDKDRTADGEERSWGESERSGEGGMVATVDGSLGGGKIGDIGRGGHGEDEHEHEGIEFGQVELRRSKPLLRGVAKRVLRHSYRIWWAERSRGSSRCSGGLSVVPTR